MIPQPLPLSKIKLFSQCPKLYQFALGATPKPISRVVDTIISTATRACSYTLKTEKRMEWKKIIEAVDVHIFHELDFRNEEVFAAARRDSESSLIFLMYWYHTIYSKDILIYPQLQVNLTKQGLHIQDMIQFITSEGVPHIFEIGSQTRSQLNLWSDIRVRSLMSFALHELDVRKVRYTYFCIGPQGGHTVYGRKDDPTLVVNYEDCIKSDQMLDQILLAMRMGFNYPAVSEQCASCQFSRRCAI